jgi:hypothetical protein
VTVPAQISVVKTESASRGRGALVASDRRGDVVMKFWLCGLCVAVALPVSGGDRLTMTVSPAQAFAPAPLRIRVWIEPSAENRSLTVTTDSGEFYRSSEMPLEGERAPRTIEIQLRDVPEGEYDIVSIVKDSAGRPRSVAHRSARILALTGSD